MRKQLASRLLQSRFQPPHELRQSLLASSSSSRPGRRRRRPTTAKGSAPYLQGVVKGNFVRFKLPTSPSHTPTRLFKLPSPATTPVKSFSQPSPTTTTTTATTTTSPLTTTTTPLEAALQESTFTQSNNFWQSYWERARAWTRHNFALIILNFGSVCSLVGFTRSDVSVIRQSEKGKTWKLSDKGRLG